MNSLKIIFLLELGLVVIIGWPGFVQAADADCTGSTAEVCLKNPLERIGVRSPAELVVKATAGFASIIGLIAIAFTVFNGFKLVIASSEEAIEKAKKGLTWSVGGFMIALLSFTIISGTAKFLGYDAGKIELFKYTLESPLSGPADPRSFISVMSYLMVNFLGLLGFATTLMIVYYGYRYLTSAGNEEAVEKAKSGLKWSVLGLVVSLLAFTIIASIEKLLVRGP